MPVQVEAASYRIDPLLINKCTLEMRDENMSIDKEQLRLLITDVLKEIDLYSPSAVELLMLTAAVESNLGTYIEQQHGPALGIFQMEPRTIRDIVTRLKVKKDLWEKCEKYFPTDDKDLLLYGKGNLIFQIILTRSYYLFKPGNLPSPDNKEALASYWKTNYNTYLGKGTVEKAVSKYETYCV